MEIHVWGLMLVEGDRSRIFQLQEQCFRIIKNAKYKSHTDPLLNKLKLLKLDDIIEYELCKFVFKLKRILYLNPSLHFFQITNIVMNVNMTSDVNKSPEAKQ